MCAKINVLYVQCTVYILHILYAHSAIQRIYRIFYIRAVRNKPFIFLVIVYLPSKDQRVMRALVK